jgi:hypothetical protein
MATIKSFTDLEQSRKLANILPLESADMYYQYVLPKSDKIKHNPEIGNPINALEWYNKGYVFGGKKPITMDEFCVPCWSLTSLLGRLPFPVLYMEMVAGMILWCCECHFIETDEVVKIEHYDNPVDVCVSMVEKLNELKIL